MIKKHKKQPIKNNNYLKLKKIINKYRKLLNIKTWSIELRIINDKSGILKKNKNFYIKENDFWAEAEEIDYNNRSFKISISEKAFERSDIEYIVLHELLHVVFWKMIEFAKLNIADLDKEEHFVIDKILHLIKKI